MTLFIRNQHHMSITTMTMIPARYDMMATSPYWTSSGHKRGCSVGGREVKAVSRWINFRYYHTQP